MPPTRLDQQISFIIELDKLKSINRQTYLIDGKRRENSAEHCWHLATMSMILAEYTDTAIDLQHVLMLLLIHDAIEIDAGDTYCYDDEVTASQIAREREAAERLFSVLPADQARRFKQLWDEFESRSTPEAKFASALDRLQPLLNNYHTKGLSWKEHGITADRVLERIGPIREGSEALWRMARSLVDNAVEKGYLAGKDGIISGNS